jgi:hypothetical protein
MPSEIPEDLTELEKEAMIVLGKLCMSPNKKFAEETLRKKLPPVFKNANIGNLVKMLKKRRWISLYRPGQYRMTGQGFRIAQFLKKKRVEDEFGIVLKRGWMLS